MNTGNVSSQLESNSNDSQTRDFSTSMLLASSEIVVITIVTLITVFVGVMANGLVVVFATLKQDYFDNPTNLLLLNQAVSDGAFCLVTGSMSIYNLYHWIFETHLLIAKCIGLVSFQSLVLLTMNRLISVYWPLKYPRWITPGRVKIVVAVTWIVSSLVGIANLVGRQIKAGELQRNARYISLLSYIIVLMCHVLLYRKSLYHRKAIKSQIHGITGMQAGRQADFSSVRSLAIVTMTAAVGWLPSTLVGLVVDRDKNPNIFYRYIMRFIICAIFSSAINPFIYYLRSQSFGLYCQRLRRFYIAPHPESVTGKCRTMESTMRRGYHKPVINIFNAETGRVGDVFVISASNRSPNVWKQR